MEKVTIGFRKGGTKKGLLIKNKHLFYWFGYYNLNDQEIRNVFY